MPGGTFTAADNKLRVKVDFLDTETGANQFIAMQTLGLGSPDNPSTFVGTTLGGHKFEPGIILRGSDLPGGAQLTVQVTPDDTGSPTPLTPHFPDAQTMR